MKRIFATLKLAANIYPKILRYQWFGIPTPVLVILGITNRCNLNCSYCFVSPRDRLNKELPTVKLLDYIDQFIALGTQQIELQGGEPTLHPDLGMIISHIVKKGATCTMATNGFKVHEHLSSLKRCYRVCVSMDGGPDTTDLHRGKGAYEIARRALDVMADNSINLRIHTVLTCKTRTADIDHLIDLANLYKTNVNFVYALDTGINITGCDGEQGFPDIIKNLASYILEKKSAGEPITSKADSIRQAMRWPFGSQDILIERDMTRQQRTILDKLAIPRCMWGHVACFFNPDDKLYLCPRAFDRKGFFVDVKGRTLKEAFKSLAKSKPCYMCGQMGDLSYSFRLCPDNVRTWLRF